VKLVHIEAACSWPALTGELVLFASARTGWEEREVAEESDPEWRWSPEWYVPYSDVVVGDDWQREAAEAADLLSLPVSGFLEPLCEPLRQHLWDDITIRQSAGLAFLTRLLAELSSVVYRFLRNMQYLGPMRPDPERLFRFNAIDATTWREEGWGSYLDFLSRKLADTSIIEQIGEWFDYLDLGPAVRPESTGLGQGFLSRVSVFEEVDSTPFNLRDVGFGAAQVLPVIVHSVLTRPGTLIIIEQPELHLHPRAQAKLGNLFVKSVSNNSYFFIETHSEHLLLRLRRWIAESASGAGELVEGNQLTLDHESLKIHFVERESKHSISSVTALTVKRNGEFKHKPSGFKDFFADDLKESVALTLASAEVE
jgi:hypothetical protein